MTFTVRPYAPADEPGWLRCRALAFLGTQYYDDVKPRRTTFDLPAITLVVVSDGGEIAGLLDVEIDGDAATIDTIAVHPDHARQGIATALLDAVLAPLRASGTATLDAWTREDRAANAWYRRCGFTENFRYLHVYKDGDEPAEGFTTPRGLSAPVNAFMHADIALEAELRKRFARIYVCRQYLRRL
ncbi:GNAT family N-acetyltransferase [Promicromonospora sp. NPDC057138]|uniref:GNAT family N-acetyltransferase n=1 Tax=Promicromonospora sp. NPDC057138 TaxID=3346031 RepID=UPI00362BFAC7